MVYELFADGTAQVHNPIRTYARIWFGVLVYTRLFTADANGAHL